MCYPQRACPSDPFHALYGEATTGAELFYLDRAVVEAQLGSLIELIEIRRREAEKRGLVKSITFAELQEIGLLGTGSTISPSPFSQVSKSYRYHCSAIYYSNNVDIWIYYL